MRQDRIQALIEIVLYIINRTGGIDYQRLFIILYFGNQRTLLEWGYPMIDDKFCAFPHGPAPIELYKAIKGDKTVLSGLKDSVYISQYYLLPKRQANTDYLSISDMEILKDCIAKYGSMSFAELESVARPNCWKAARENPENPFIEAADIARDGGAHERLIEYINEMIEFDKLMA